MTSIVNFNHISTFTKTNLMLTNLNVLHYQHSFSHDIKFKSNLCHNGIPLAVKRTILFSKLYTYHYKTCACLYTCVSICDMWYGYKIHNWVVTWISSTSILDLWVLKCEINIKPLHIQCFPNLILDFSPWNMLVLWLPTTSVVSLRCNYWQTWFCLHRLYHFCSTWTQISST